MLQQIRDTESHCCLIVKYLSQLQKQFISPVPLVQFNWYCEQGGDKDEALTWGRDLINLFFPKDVYRRSLFFFLALRARSRELADVLEKNENKNKTRSVYRLWNSLPLDLRKSPSLIGFKKGLKTNLFWQFLESGSLFL